MTRRPAIALLAAVALLSGCVGFTLVKGGEPVELGEEISVKPGTDWNRMAQGKTEIWTRDGLPLQRLYLVKGVEDGERLIGQQRSIGGDDDEKFPVFRKGMSPLEVRELFQETLARGKAQRIRISDFRPQEFGGKPGFRFDYAYTTEGGLDMLGLAAGAIVGDRLYLAFYMGARLEYFARARDDVDAIIRSWKFR